MPVGKLPWKRMLIAFGVIAISVWIWLAYTMVREGFDLSRTPLPEFTNLFNKETQSELPKPYTFKSKIQGPSSGYNFSNDFYLLVSKLVLKNDLPLGQILHLENEYPDRSYEVYTSLSDDSELEMTESSDKIYPIYNINFKYQGTIKTIQKNDSIACYYLKFTSFSLSYDKNSDNDFWGKSKNSKPVAISWAFIKKKKNLYVMLLMKNSYKDRDFSPESLYNMIKK